MANRLSKPGPKSLFRGKRRAPVSLTLTPAHHNKVKANTRRLGVTRADLVGLLIEKFSDVVSLPGKEQKYERLRDALSVLGGRLERQNFSGPRGETWVIELGGKQLPIESDGKTFPLLDACYANQGVPTEDHLVINPAGVAQLLAQLTTSGQPVDPSD